MARLDVMWEVPKFIGYSILGAAAPGVCWQDPSNNPLIREYKVQILRVEDGKWLDVEQTSTDYATIDAQAYTLTSSYQFRIATIGVNRTRSSWSYSPRFIASPLRFDFTASNTVRLPSGESKRNQRLLFLLF